MSEILRQKDIDVLFLGSAAVAPPSQVTPWDFTRSPRVSRDRRVALKAVQERFACSLETFLGARLRVPAEVGVVGLEEVTAAEFALSLGAPCAAWVFGTGGRSAGRGVLDLGADLSLQLVDRLFGGSGDPMPVSRVLTTLEQSVLRSLAGHLLVLLGEAWQEQVSPEDGELAFEANPDLLQATGGGDGMLAALFTVRIGTGGGTVSIGLPLPVVEPFPGEEVAQSQSSARGEEGAESPDRPRVEGALRLVRMELTARLPAFALSARSVGSLAAGQVLHTSLSAETPVELLLNGKPRFRGSLGQIQRYVGLRIQQPVTRPAAERPARPREGRVL